MLTAFYTETILWQPVAPPAAPGYEYVVDGVRCGLDPRADGWMWTIAGAGPIWCADGFPTAEAAAHACLAALRQVQEEARA